MEAPRSYNRRKSQVGKSPKSGRLVYLDFLRLIAIVAVVVIHTATSVCAWNPQGMDSFSYGANVVAEALSRWGVPVLVMISGALLLNPSHNVTLGDTWRRRIPRIAIAFIFWSAFYVVFAFVAPYLNPLEKSIGLKEALYKLVTGEFHLWYCWMIMALYAATPLIRCFSSNRVYVRYFLVIAFCVQFLPRLFIAFGVFPGAITSIYDSLHADFFSGMVFYYLLGHYLANQWERDDTIGLYVGVLVASTLVNIVAGWFLGGGGAYPNEDAWSPLFPTNALQAAAIFLLSKSLFAKRGEALGGILESVGAKTFGMYLCHIFFLRLLGMFELLRPTSILPLDVIISVAVVAVLSYALTALMLRIPGLKRVV